MSEDDRSQDRDKARDALEQASQAALGEFHVRADAFIRIAEVYLHLGLSHRPDDEPSFG